jgi:regulator of PEP synthase PpsR (kinase-PPPase family)
MSLPTEQRLKLIIVSDGTGETASAMARATMAQFPGQDVYFTRYKNVRTKKQLEAIFTEAAINHDMVVYTIVSAELREQIKELSRVKHVRSVDLMGELLTAFSNFFDRGPDSSPGLLHAVNDQYFKRVAAMEFTLNHDDGRKLESLHLADIVLVGISRTSKTPLSIYLSLHGIKVINIPLVYGTEIHPELFKIDQRKIIGLTIDSQVLFEIRQNRLGHLGVGGQSGNYADLAQIKQEVDWANSLFKANKRWPVFDVTGKALEEIAANILKLYHMRQNNYFKQQHRKK